MLVQQFFITMFEQEVYIFNNTYVYREYVHVTFELWAFFMFNKIIILNI